jgi:hypothetical protein
MLFPNSSSTQADETPLFGFQGAQTFIVTRPGAIVSRPVKQLLKFHYQPAFLMGIFP